MSPRLKPLLLPSMLADRRKKELQYDDETEISACYFRASNYSASDISAPNTPIYSSRGRLICPSSSSTLDSHISHSFLGSPSSQSYMGTKTSRSSLPDVQEEESEDLSEDEASSDYCLCQMKNCPYRDSQILQSSTCSEDCDQTESIEEIEYDLSDGYVGNGDGFASTKFKKRRIGDSPLLGFATRLGTLFPIFSRKWRSKSSAKTAPAPVVETSHPSRGLDHPDYCSSLSSYDEKNDWIFTPNVDMIKANSYEKTREEATSTPLLPPLMTEASANLNQVPMRSPLQSPSVAEGNCSLYSGSMTLRDLGYVAPIVGSNKSFSSLPAPRRRCGQASRCDSDSQPQLLGWPPGGRTDERHPTNTMLHSRALMDLP